MEAFQENKVYFHGQHYAMVVVKAPDTGKALYTLFEYPVSKYQEPNSYAVIASCESYEEMLICAVKYLGFFTSKYHELSGKISDIYDNDINKYAEVEWKYQKKIDMDFCEKEMGISKAQLQEQGARSWNLIFKEKKEWLLGTQ